MVNERQTHSPLFRGLTKSPFKKCLEEIEKLKKRVLKIEKLILPITGKGGKDGKDT